MIIYEKPDELYHHGVKGMKWGQHIYGRRRPSSGQNRSGQQSSQKNGKSGKQNPGSFKQKHFRKKNEQDVEQSKTFKNMSDDELKKKTARLNLEADYLTATERVKEKQPVKQNNFAKKFLKESVSPAVVSVGKNQLENYLNKKVSELIKGKVNKNSYEYIKAQTQKQADLYKLKNDISVYKKTIASNDDWFAQRKKG